MSPPCPAGKPCGGGGGERCGRGRRKQAGRHWGLVRAGVARDRRPLHAAVACADVLMSRCDTPTPERLPAPAGGGVHERGRGWRVGAHHWHLHAAGHHPVDPAVSGRAGGLDSCGRIWGGAILPAAAAPAAAPAAAGGGGTDGSGIQGMSSSVDSSWCRCRGSGPNGFGRLMQGGWRIGCAGGGSSGCGT